MLFDRHPSRSVWDVFGDMQRVLDVLGTSSTARQFGFGAHEYPPINVWANDDRVAVEAEVPGIDPDSIELTVEGDTLTITAKRELSAPEDARWLRRERGDLDFTRSIRLPFAVDASSAEARVANGVLVVALQREASDSPRTIKVQAG